ncbi:hypothetical protein Tco_1565184, partial [Tanacetum coccineum]
WRLLASFQDDAKYEHVGQDTRSQGGKDDQDKQGKYLKISDIKTKSKDNDKGSRSKITKHEGTSLQRIQRPRPQDLNDKNNLIDLTKECHNELTSGEIVSLKILSRTRKFVHYIRVTDTYRLELPEKLSSIHNTFHVSNLKKCLSDESLIIPMKELQLDDKLNFVEEPVEVMDREIKQLKRSRIPIIKV